MGQEKRGRRATLLVVGLEDIEEVFGIAGDVAGPVAKAAMSVHGLDPLGQEFAFGLILLAVQTFDFDYQHLAAGEADKLAAGRGVDRRRRFCASGQADRFLG